MAAAEPDDETAMGSQVLGPEKSQVLSILGPGLITGASDDDPSGIATYSQVGAQFGFSISWTMLFSYPFMAAIQEISGRIGRTTGRGIAGNIRRHYPAWLLNAIVGLLFIANTINIGADLGAMGDALSLLVGGPHRLLCRARGCLCVVLQIFVPYKRYVSVLKWLTLSPSWSCLFLGGEMARGLFIPTRITGQIPDR
jgi:Mn2+/Fe2+ NRAMP family transporter